LYQEAEEDEVENHEALVDVDIELALDCSEFEGPSEIWTTTTLVELSI